MTAKKSGTRARSAQASLEGKGLRRVVRRAGASHPRYHLCGARPLRGKPLFFVLTQSRPFRRGHAAEEPPAARRLGRPARGDRRARERDRHLPQGARLQIALFEDLRRSPNQSGAFPSSKEGRERAGYGNGGCADTDGRVGARVQRQHRSRARLSARCRGRERRRKLRSLDGRSRHVLLSVVLARLRFDRELGARAPVSGRGLSELLRAYRLRDRGEEWRDHAPRISSR